MARDETILLLHGQPGAARDWDRVRAAIGGRGRTIAIDRPGWNGRSAPRDLEGNAQAALAPLDDERIDRATVVGHSFGGAVAAWLAARYPARVEALVLVAPSANLASLSRLDSVLAAPVVGRVASSALLAGLGLALETAPVRARIAGGLALDDRYLEVAGRLLLRPSSWRAFFLEQRLLFRELPALEARLPDISAPTTIVAGAADRIVPATSARRLKDQIPEAELVLLDRADHLLPLRNAQRLAEVIVGAAGVGWARPHRFR